MKINYLHQIAIRLFLFFLTGFFSQGYAQEITSNIRGMVVAAHAHDPLVGANVQLLQDSMTLGINTDENGAFIIENIAVGRYQLQVSFVGYETQQFSEILVESGRETIVEVTLKENPNELKAIVVKADNGRIDLSNYLSHHIMDIEKTERFPATFYDPARLAASFPGVVNTNDQTNNFSIRGNSPANMRWYLEGVEIVSPNHLSTAGMFGNQISLNGGGVNILSAQMLNTSTLMKGAYPTNYGNAAGGIMDMRLRNGNNQQYQFTGQAGVLGFDFSAEGPFTSSSKAAFLVNYRYSFTGLLAAMGVDFGGEEIAFQDFSATIHLPTQKLGNFKLFGIWGDSRNDFTGIVDENLRVEDKERFTINYDSEVWIAGLSHALNIGANLRWNTSIVYSKSAQSNTKVQLDNRQIGNEFDVNEEEKWSIHSFLQKTIGQVNQLRIGLVTNYWDYFVQNGAIANIDNFLGFYANGTNRSTLWQPYLQYQHQFKQGFALDFGFRYTYFDLTDYQAVEPRLAISWQINPRQKLYLTGGRTSQTQSSYLYAFVTESNFSSLDFKSLDTWTATIGWKNNLNAWELTTEVFYQFTNNVPFLFSGAQLYATNYAGSLQEVALPNGNSGKSQQYGVEVNLSRPLLDGSFVLLNATFYESQFKGMLIDWQDSPWNGNYAFNVTYGKEYWKKKAEKSRVLGWNVHAVYTGGLRTKLIDPEGSAEAGITQLAINTRFQGQLANYFRPDLRVYLKWNRAKYNALLSLDIQNFINGENEAFYFYDFVQNEVALERQLGMIPVLNYRIEF